MKSSSPDLNGARASVLTGDAAGEGTGVRAVLLAGRELRTGGWTRLGGASVLGDTVTEHALDGLAGEARAAARAQGYSTGWAEGRRAAEARARAEAREAAARTRAAEERREAEHRQSVDALVRAAAELQRATAEVCARVEDQVSEVAFAVVQELLGRELAVAANPGVDAVRRALALAPGEPVVRVRVSPDQAARPELAGLTGPAVVVADPALGRGDAVVETAHGVVDARLDGALQRVREVLAP